MRTALPGLATCKRSAPGATIWAYDAEVVSMVPQVTKRMLPLALLLLALLGCNEEARGTVVEGPAPIPKILYLDTRIVVYPTLPWEDLIHAEIFEGFRPDMTFSEAELEIGKPDRIIQGIWGRTYEYKRENGIVLLSREEIKSGSSGAVY